MICKMNSFPSKLSLKVIFLDPGFADPTVLPLSPPPPPPPPDHSACPNCMFALDRCSSTASQCMERRTMHQICRNTAHVYFLETAVQLGGEPDYCMRWDF